MTWTPSDASLPPTQLPPQHVAQASQAARLKPFNLVAEPLGYLNFIFTAELPWLNLLIVANN
jgi:hypothetical protein